MTWTGLAVLTATVLTIAGCGDGADPQDSAPVANSDRQTAAPAPGPASGSASRELISYFHRVPTMGTEGSITLAVPDSATGQKLARIASESWGEVDSLMSNWTPTSEIARINREAGADDGQRGGVIVHPEVAAVIERAIRIGQESGGAFDITVEPLVRLWGFLGGTPRVPANEQIEQLQADLGIINIDFSPSSRAIRFANPRVRIDLGGIAKGYGVDAAVEEMVAAGAGALLVDLSGNIRTHGLPPGRDHWTIGIRDPRGGASSFFAYLDIEATSLATSGNYEQFVTQDGHRYGHILDPRTGWPAEGTLAVTVVTASAMDADGWATALYVMGPKLAQLTLIARKDLAGIIVEPGAADSGTASVRDIVWIESSLVDRFTLVPGSEERFEVRPF